MHDTIIPYRVDKTVNGPSFFPIQLPRQIPPLPPDAVELNAGRKFGGI